MIGFSADVMDALMTRMEAFADEFERLATTPEQRGLVREFGGFLQDMDVMIVAAAALSPPARKYWEEIFKDKGVRDEPEARCRDRDGARDF